MNPTLRAVIYCRVSTDRQAEEGTSLETQEHALRQRADQMAAAVVGVFIDSGVSGADYETREQLQAALHAIEAGRANLFLVYSTSRLSRDTEHAAAIRKRIRNASAKLIIHDLPVADDAIGRLMHNQFTSFEEFRREIIREETMRGCRRIAEKGIQPSRGRRPFGYDLVTQRDVIAGHALPGTEGTYIRREAEAHVVEDPFRRYASGGSLMGLANWLTASGVPTPKGGEIWRPRTILYMLSNPVYKGQALYGRSETFNDERRKTERGLKSKVCQRVRVDGPLYVIPAPAIVDETTWNDCQARLKENQRMMGGNPKRRYLLSGLLRCPECGRGLAGRAYAGLRYYACNRNEVGTHAKKCLPVELVETAVVNGMVQGLNAEPSIAAAMEAYEQLRVQARDKPAVNSEALRIELETLDKRESAVARAQVDAFTKGRDTAVYDKLLDEITATRRSVQAKLLEAAEIEKADSFPPEAPMDAVRAIEALYKVLTAEDVLSVAERREAIRGFVKDVIPADKEIAIRFHPFTTDGDTVQLGVVIYQRLSGNLFTIDECSP